MISQGTAKGTKCAAIWAALAILVSAGGVLWATSGHVTAQTEPPHSSENSLPGFVRKGEQIVVPESSSMRPQLVVAPVELQDLPRTLVVPATVEADPARTVNILPPVTGKVIDLKVHLGDHVSKGQVLIVLASGDFAQADTDLKKTRDALQLTKTALERARGVFEAGGSARKDVEQAESAYVQASEEYQRADARVKAVGGSVRDDNKTHQLMITAPSAGSVTALSTATGAFLNDTTVPVMTIANLDSIWITASVPESAAGAIAKGQKVDVALPARPGEVFHGTVTFVSDVLDPDTRSDKVRITFANRNGAFKPNMFASATFTIPQEPQIFVPNAALLMNNDRTTVFVETGPWSFVRRTVELGYEEGGKALIRKGLSPGELILVRGGILLND